jgi:polyferredoxin
VRAGHVRFAAGLLTLAVFSAGFFSAAGLLGPLQSLLVSLQFAPALLRLTAGGTAAAAGAAVIIVLILASSMLFSRVYCGLLCPAGLLQDLVGRLRRHKYRRQPGLGRIHYPITLLTAAGAAAGLMTLVTLIEPYALFGRIMRDLAGPVASGAVNLAGRLLLPFGIYLPSWPLAVHPGAAAVTGVLALLLAAAVLLAGRIFCNTLCPVGGILRLSASKSLYGIRLETGNCISCGACEAVCPAGCIDLTTKSVDTGRCVMCLDCLGICPVNAIEYRQRPVASPARLASGLTERRPFQFALHRLPSLCKPLPDAGASARVLRLRL